MPIIKPSQLTYTREIPEEWRAVEQAAKLLDVMCHCMGGRLGASTVKPSHNSTYAKDSERDGDLAKLIHARAHDLFLLAIDNARSVARSFQPFPITLAGFTCGRAVLESCSTASWLIDSDEGVNTEGRIRRYFAFVLDGHVRIRRQLNNSENRALLEISLTETEQMYQATIDDVQKWSEDLGIQPKPDKGTPRHPVFYDIPRATDLADRYFKHGARRYQLYSAIVHGKPWAIDSQWLVRADLDDPCKFMYQPKLAFSLIVNVMTWLEQSCGRILDYLGQDFRDIEYTPDHYYRELALLLERAGFEQEAK